MIDEVFKAAQSGDDTPLREILEANPVLANTENGDGLTPLGFAAHYGQLNIVKLLLNYGADVDARSRSNCTWG
jgi:ankyrin repeat protein